MKHLFPLLLLLLATSCGYRFGKGEAVSQYRTLTIPYAGGDEDGRFTAELIRQFTESGALCLSNCNGQLILEVCIAEPDDENIGFTYARKKNTPIEENKRTRKVVSNEGRVTVTATVSLREAATGLLVLGPCDITTFEEFDFEPDLSTFEDHAFSLGQLEMHPLALDAARLPLYERLAQKIVDYILHSW